MNAITFNSAGITLDELVEGFIQFKRATGYCYNTEEYYLKKFVLHCKTKGCTNAPGKAEFLAWIAKRPNELPQTQHTRISPIRQLYAYMQDMGWELSFVLPKSVKNSSDKYRPHYFREEEIIRFFSACNNLAARKENPCREIILPAAFRLIYCLGLRPFEAIRLKTSDVSLKNGYIDIIGSKHHRDRRLFISVELVNYLSEYAMKIRSVWSAHKFFLPKGEVDCYADGYLSTNFQKIWASIANAHTDGRVRLYDMRHHFAFENINRWIREGKDVNAMVAYLSKYMGHSSIECTYYYIHLVPHFFKDYASVVKNLADVLPEVEYED
ncbi:MAG: site-specific integrase [Defluviitaleaceae bacterium]|nr:site-specific integrase [Defluviitaleaceae bacterium]